MSTTTPSITSATEQNNLPLHTRPFFQANMSLVSTETLATLQNESQTRIETLVTEAFGLLPADATHMVSQRAAVEYVSACTRTRTKLSSKDLAEALNKGDAFMTDEAHNLLSTQLALTENITKRTNQLRQEGRLRILAVPATPAETEKPSLTVKQLIASVKSAFNIKKAVKTMPANTSKAPPLPAALARLPWDENGRVYLKLEDNSLSPIAMDVIAALAKVGCTVTDYVNNRAVDARKNERKIGKVIKDNKGLLAAFFNDPSRASKDLMVVLTRNVEDVARGSVDRGWKSCRADITSAANYAVEEVNLGAFSAYLVNVTDVNIDNPHARINIKPYDRITGRERGWDAKTDNTDTIYAPFNPIGLHHPGFVDAIYTMVEALNGDKTGWYKLRWGCEDYREFKTRRLLPKDAKAALKELGIPFTADKDGGNVVVHGNLNLTELGLLRLPDLRDVTVLGDIDVSNNRLLTLEGLPTGWAKSVRAQKNLLVCLAGAPQRVEGTFSYRDNPWLMSTAGAPAAANYVYGNGDRDSTKYGEGDKPIGPIEEPRRFPGFKR